MILHTLPAQIALGKDSSRQFNVALRNGESQAAWPEIDFASDPEACLFTATIHRHVLDDTKNERAKTSGKTSGKILAAVRQNAGITIPDLAALIGISERSVERNIQKIQNEGCLRRIGPAKGGHWEILE